MANEKRLIDANALLEEQRIMYHYSRIENAPTVDAVEVVRCKDCKHYKIGLCYGWHCVEEDDFCSYGERREEE